MKISEFSLVNTAVKILITVTVMTGYFGQDDSISSYRVSGLATTGDSISERNYLLNEFNDFYGNAYVTTGKVASVEDKDTTYEVSEIIIGNDTKAKGYLIKQQNDYLYLIDVDRANNILKVFDFATEENLVFKDIDKHVDYDETYGFDLIKIIADSDYQNREPHQRFWGWSCGEEYTSDDMNCYRNCCYYIMWSSQGCSQYYCDKLPDDESDLVKK